VTHVSLAHRIVARYLKARTVWVVRDWDNRTEYIREICFPVDASVLEDKNPPSWAEHCSVFKDEVTAMRDLERRMKVVDKWQGKHGYFRHMHSDGRIIYVNSPDHR
jgi:hypothetical protein